MGLFDSGAGDAAKALKKYFNMSAQFLEPYRNLGEWSIEPIKGVDPTGGAGQFLDKLKNYGENFKVNTEDPTYKFRTSEAEKGVNRFLASRGLFNSRPGLNALQQSTNQITAEEAQNQYNRGYQQITDSFNMANTLGQEQFSKLFNLLNVGSGAAGQTSNAALQTGSGIANAKLQGGASQLGFVSDLLGLPVNFLTLKYLLGNNKQQTNSPYIPAT